MIQDGSMWSVHVFHTYILRTTNTHTHNFMNKVCKLGRRVHKVRSNPFLTFLLCVLLPHYATFSVIVALNSY